jgi:hypothetical protein
MIQSPCKNCDSLYLPKYMCSRDCDKIKLIQKFQLSITDGPYTAIDCTDSGRYRLCLPVSANS